MTTTKVLPFEGVQGFVAGHEINRPSYPWLKSPIKTVVFETWNETAKMMVEIHIHWTQWTQWTKKTWPNCGSIKAAICEDGQRVYATSRAFLYNDEAKYSTAPLVCRDCFCITTLDGSHTLLEVVGVREWVRTGKPMKCPWERDNEAFAARASA